MAGPGEKIWLVHYYISNHFSNKRFQHEFKRQIEVPIQCVCVCVEVGEGGASVRACVRACVCVCVRARVRAPSACVYVCALQYYGNYFLLHNHHDYKLSRRLLVIAL